MISYIEGIVKVKAFIKDDIIITVLAASGVGYEINYMGSISRENLVDVSLYIHTHVREDLIALYGFDSIAASMLFRRLCGIPGIGPGKACVLMRGRSASDIIHNIKNSNTEKIITKGISHKTADKVVEALTKVYK